VRFALASLLLVAVTGSLLVAGTAGAADQPSTIYVDKNGGYRITVPRTWQVVPPSVAAVRQTITRLKKQKKTDLATFYANQISTAAGRKELSTFRFRAFRWPLLPSPVPTDVTLIIQPVARRYGEADLPGIGATFARNLASPGAKISKPQMLKLPAGRAALITGTVPLPRPNQAIKTGFTLVVLIRPGRLYILSFRIDSRGAADAKVFTSIADLFRLT
jgi:hypothetical protein